MTLRFFRRKGGSSRSSEEPAEDTPAGKDTAVETPKRTQRGTRSRTTTTSDEPKLAAAPSGTSTGRTRRGRRGGVGRKKKPVETKAEEAVVVPEPAPPPVLRPRGRTAKAGGMEDGLLTEVMERQLEMLKSVQGSLSAIENRLAVGAAFGAERPRLGIFVDVPNVMYAAERQKVKLDYAKLLDFLTQGRELVRASAYAPISDDPGQRFDTQRFVQPFANLGYRLVTKPHKRYADGSMKANFDVELAIDVVAMSDRLDVVSLVSGDGDFRRLVELVASKGVRVEVIAFSQSTAQELRAVADRYIDLNDYLADLKP